jgi:phosphocarrier protein HPr
MSQTHLDADTVVKEIEIVNKRGLHARASARFVRLVEEHDCEVTVAKDGITVGGTSIMGLMMLAASPGCCIRVAATGPDAARFMDALERMVSSRFGEED